MRILPRSFALRVALLSAAVVLVLSLIGSGWGWIRAEQALRQQIDLALAAEAEGFLREYEAFGAAALATSAESVARRRGPLLVLLQGVGGVPVAGWLPGAPPALQGFATIRSGDDTLRALGARLPGGLNLILATDLDASDEAAAVLAWTPPVAALVAGTLALLVGFAAARTLERRLARVSDAAAAVMAGDLTRRLPETGRGDEFDRLVGTTNAVLARVETLVAAQRQVTDDIAHDLRSPLSRLRQRLEAALARARDPAADLSALVGAMAETYAAVAEEGGRTLTAEVAPGVMVSGDAALLRQALANLLDNSIVHGAGRIALRLRAGPVIEVADDGPGIPSDQREAVTRRFHRLDSSRNTPGTGLGLALVAATARLHGGQFRIENGLGGRGITAQLDLTRPA